MLFEKIFTLQFIYLNLSAKNVEELKLPKSVCWQ